MLRDLSLDVRRCRGCADGVIDNLHIVRFVLIEADRWNQCTVTFSEPTVAQNIQLSKRKGGDERMVMGLKESKSEQERYLFRTYTTIYICSRL
jgi:hypothetical protein